MSRQPYTEVVEPEQHEPTADFHAVEDEELAVRHVRPRWYVEDGMGKRILGVLVAVLVLGLLWYAYQRHVAAQANDGSVTMDDNSTKASQDTTPDAPVAKKTFTPVSTPAPAPVVASYSPAPAAVPATDSIAPNPTNGMTFAGTGKFQVYRQGNLTWRVDTETGKTCIVFATLEEWKKPIVYEHGCATS